MPTPLSPEAQAIAAEPANVAMARRLAARAASRCGAHPDALESAAMLGLVEAAGSFDPGRGLKFATFAGPRILGAIADEGRSWGGRPGSHRSRFRPASLEEAIDSGDGKAVSLRDTVAADEGPAGDALESADLVEAVARSLPAHLGRVIRLHYADCRGQTLAGVGKILKLSESRISQLHMEAIAMLRERVNGTADHPADPDPRYLELLARRAARVPDLALDTDPEPAIPETSPPVVRPRSSGYRGVSFIAKGEKWQASVCTPAGVRYVGKFPTEEEAARAYDRRARELLGDRTRPNFPDDADDAPPAAHADADHRSNGSAAPAPSPTPAPVAARPPATPRASKPAPPPAPAGDPEVAAIAAVSSALGGLGPDAVERVLAWAAARFRKGQP